MSQLVSSPTPVLSPMPSGPPSAAPAAPDPPPRQTAVLLAIAETLVMQAVAQLIEKDRRFRVAGNLSHPPSSRPDQQVWPRSHWPQCDVAVIDGRRPPIGLAEALAECQPAGCVILSTPDAHHTVADLALEGVKRAVIPWTAPWTALHEAITRVSPADAPQLSPGPDWAKERAMLHSLTLREREVLRLIAEEHSVRDIATALHLSESTVDNHKSRLMRKIGVKKSLSLMRFAIRVGVATP